MHPKLRQMLEKRSVREGGIDWGTGELIAFGSMLIEGTPVRLAGQDSRRGTFVQRHAVLIDKKNAAEWTPLLYLGEGQGKFWVYDSLLSEFAAMGFEYGYSVERPDAPRALGGAVRRLLQRRADHRRRVHLELGAEVGAALLRRAPPAPRVRGAGARPLLRRIERFLTMCAEGNMTVAYPSTPASYFHLLRRQAYARPRRPLIVFTPKSMLRLKAASSSPEEFTNGTFLPVVPDRPDATSGEVARAHRGRQGRLRPRGRAREARRHGHGILRLEQYYPLPAADLAAALAHTRGPRSSRAGRAATRRLAVPRPQPARGARRSR